MSIPTCVERISALQGAAQIIEQMAENLEGSPPYSALMLVASVIRRETAAIGEALERHDLHEAPCPSVSEVREDDEVPAMLS